MKDFISKVTFGFLMAQLLPGAVVVLALTCTLHRDNSGEGTCLDQILTCIDTYWFQLPFRTIAFLFVSVAVGMLVHGVNWTVLAWLEQKYPDSRQSFWHREMVAIQVVTSPIKMIIEVLWLFAAPNVDSLTTEENVNKVHGSRMPQFIFLEEFYLHFGQFYAHMAYATLVVTILAAIRCIQQPSVVCLFAVVGFYILTSVFFLLGRVQLGSLFVAERSLVGEPDRSEAPTIQKNDKTRV